ncbi:malate dehydrogenase, cytoplasmic-like [Syzygium oleosum]|uniref:malate dehydrogenase, cytoplasmic-like n=1 Tax=Syzygium oleosum TaxID=219896 RepID=UPI0011D18FF5|nr:malate dehydrogenase, cytoplasmic-like [Syzygium oleosum]
MAHVSPPHHPKDFVRILITKGAGRLGAKVARLAAVGGMLGQNHRVRLHLLCWMIYRRPWKVWYLRATMKKHAKVFILQYSLHIFGKRTPMSRFKAMEKKFGIYREIAQSLGAHAHHECKVLLVSHPASLETVIFQQFAPQIPLANITSLIQADHDRAVDLIAEMLHVARERMRNLIMWGINSSVQHMDINHNTVVDNLVGPPDAVRIRLNDDAWIMNELRRNI